MQKYPNIFSDHIELGDNVRIEPTAVIRGLKENARSVKIGDNVYIGHNVQIICDDFSLGDYCSIHHDTNIHGYKPCSIGHNAWIGQFTIIDCIGGTTIGNNCGIGAHSQLWSHIKYGDTLEGNRFLGEKPMNVGNDVWFVGHCIVSPITAEDKSMAMAGSVVLKDMKANHIYGGSPATDLTEKMGAPFSNVTVAEKFKKMIEYKNEFMKTYAGKDTVVIAETLTTEQARAYLAEGISCFDVDKRRYTKTKSAQEVAFMRSLLPDKGKFVPFTF